MFESVETRWFFRGTAPADARDWFKFGSSLGVEEPARVDRYLVLPGCQTVSVKARQGNIEVKALVGGPERVSWGREVSGLRDQWVKWSKPLAPEAMRQLVATNGDDWLLIRKRRFLRKFSLDDGAPKEVAAATARPDEGCQVELTRVEALGLKSGGNAGSADWPSAEPWWSLSLEAFGGRGRLISNLDRVAGRFFGQEVPVALTEPASMSYPVWIAKFTGQDLPGSGENCRSGFSRDG